MQLSKSEYMMYLKHPAWLWYKKHDKAKLPEVDANTQAMFDAGSAFEWYAEQRFPGGKTLGFDNYQQYQSLPRRTQKALDEGTETVFQARFVGEDLTCICDIVTKVDSKTLDIYEIKSSTRVKDEHVSDLGFQLVALEKAGWNVRNMSIIHVNKEYTRQGEIDPYGLTELVDTTEKAKAVRGVTEQYIKEAWEVIKQDEPPDISPRYASPSGFKEWLEIYKQLVGDMAETSIYHLYSPGGERIGKLEDAGIHDIADIPDDFDLTTKQQWQVSAVKSGEQHRNTGKIQEFLSTLNYPLYFLDYETLSDVVPPFNGMRPYEQLPFQYSLHVLNSPQEEPEHYEYLHTKDTNPAPALVEKLQKDIGQNGTILVWSEQFEKKCNRLMERLYPKGASFLEDVNSRIKDLMLPFASGWFIDARSKGSASIKDILPVLAPELSYKELDVQEGGSAQRLWMDAVLRRKTETNNEELFSQLSQYCSLDTLAMVRIYQRLHSNNEQGNPFSAGEQLQIL